MAHFAEIDDAGMVHRVVVVNNSELEVDGAESEEKGLAFLESLYGPSRWVQTSFNSRFRGRFAGIGMRYDQQSDTFVNE